MVWRDQERGSGGNSDTGSGNHGDNETETLLEPSVTSPDVESVDGAQHPVLVSSATTEEAEPLIDNPNSSRQQHRKVATPSSSRKQILHNEPSKTSRGVPVMVTLDPSDRTSLNSGTTMYMRTSPMHPQPHPCRGAASEAPPGAAASERPGLTRPSPSPIPMLPCTTASSTTVVTNTANSQEAIHLATVNENSPKSLASCQNLDLYSICSPKSLCGPHPRKVTIVVVLVLSIWASFVLGINIHKRVITMEDKLASMTQKMLDLQFKYLDLEVHSAREITRLHEKVNVLTETTVQKERPYPVSNSRRNSKKPIVLEKRGGSQKVTTTTIPPTTTTKGECVTKKGVQCILPFKFQDENHDGCVRRWQDTGYWCSTRVDNAGFFVSDEDAWDYCDTSLCPTTTQGGDTFTWG